MLQVINHYKNECNDELDKKNPFGLTFHDAEQFHLICSP